MDKKDSLLEGKNETEGKHQKEYGNKKPVIGAGLLFIAVVFGCFLFCFFKGLNEREIRKNEINKALSDEVINDEIHKAPDFDGLEGKNSNVIDKDVNEDDTLEEVFNNNRNTPTKVKGIYISGPVAGTKNTLNNIVRIVDETEVNAIVVDIKNDSGEITYKMQTPTVLDIKSGVNYIRDIDGFIKRMKEKNIYLIARIVAFKDPILAKKKPELSLKNSNGTIFTDKAGLSWVNPYKKEVWEYLIEVAAEAARIGFDEIQFDYIRFSTDSGMKQVIFTNEEEAKSKEEVISEFTKYACEKLKPMGVYVSADVYGSIISSKTDADIIGQDYIEMSKYLDYICPMIYPSHYVDGAYGIDYPDLAPYQLISKALEDSKNVLSVIDEGEHKAVVRPWLQDFTASWIKNHQKYGKKQIREQIEAVYDSGYEEWILWNGSNKYTEAGLEK